VRATERESGGESVREREREREGERERARERERRRRRGASGGERSGRMSDATAALGCPVFGVQRLRLSSKFGTYKTVKARLCGLRV